jgi:hypothetical protein
MRVLLTRFERRVYSSGQKNTLKNTGERYTGYGVHTLQQSRWLKGRRSSKTQFLDLGRKNK